MIVNFRTQIQNNEFKWVPFIKLEKKHSCTCFTYDKPKITITQLDSDELLGYIINNKNCYKYNFGIYENESLIYSITANCCQCGFYFSYPVALCEIVDLSINDINGNVVGTIHKVWTGCDKPGYSYSDSYEVKIPKDISAKHKALLLACALFIDYEYFEEKIQHKASK